MKAILGMVSLLVGLAVVGVMVSKQLKVAGQAGDAAASGPQTAPAGTVADQSRQMQEKVRKDLNEAMEQAARRSDPDN